MSNNITVRRGDIFYADLNPVIGSEQGGTRPVLVVQNDIGNKYYSSGSKYWKRKTYRKRIDSFVNIIYLFLIGFTY